ncbi:eukaryotic translation initiation factor 4E [Malassezia vespertilionis]|uniref:Eukaryotic translation initiation factor 4E n=1 Tax=Malassezia vespertilionis TaxID=2020962 RepID=A0A2N1J978_9BASI|nr:eukaryotic translation initiation factor 4E [Malassezia vespertilionis]PKI83115.1 Tif45p [Malassezia vespertilionis]WFD07523.1 eukaryotic translation initiation factor 4E [Malassezia vespertilionis]
MATKPSTENEVKVKIPGAGKSALSPEAELASKAALATAMEESNIALSPSEETQDGDVKTVFQDPSDFNLKHPLFNKWTLWFDNLQQKGVGSAKERRESWGANLHKVVGLDSVEEFWGLYNNIVPPSSLPQSSNYYLFKDGIQPAWEDPANGNGGKWSLQLPREKHRGQIDKLWLYTMLAAIGETLETPSAQKQPPCSREDELVTGVILQARPNYYRISIWTRRADEWDDGDMPDGEVSESILVGRRLKDMGRFFKTDVLGYPMDAKVGGGFSSEVEFQSHKDSEKKRGKRSLVS